MPAFEENEQPFYRRIMNDLMKRINRGDLPPGTQLPTAAELAKEYGVSYGTARGAIIRLIEAGVLRGHQGLGVFVAEKPPQG
jgi:DNA-binding GntR family transcriptional regulator